MARDVGGLLLEMKENPQLEAWIGNGEPDAIVTSLVFRLFEHRVLIDVEHAPHFIEEQRVVIGSPRFSFGTLLQSNSRLDQSLRDTARVSDHDLDQPGSFCLLNRRK